MSQDSPRRFQAGWVVSGIGIGIVLELLAWSLGFGIFAGLPGFLIMGGIVGVLSEGSTIIEPGLSAFIMATIGFIIDHIFMSLLGAGLVVAVVYGVVGLVVAMVGGFIGEKLQGTR